MYLGLSMLQDVNILFSHYLLANNQEEKISAKDSATKSKMKNIELIKFIIFQSSKDIIVIK